jgi:tRNA threonylcarbamoyladenosine biosynthesis protein TsaE
LKKTYYINTLSDLPIVATQIWADFGEQTLFLLSGDLGAGKTTLVQAFGAILNVADDVVSPTYTVINEYKTHDGRYIYHVDLYRIETLEDAIQTGIEDHLYSQSPCFVEWPAIIEAILPPKFVKLEISINASGPSQTNAGQPIGRKITAELHA